ncbi:polysaccharide pyruvyl transferase family protein [Burkholderia sp. GS2Y]|uniref:Polysaccharide pyruvyl transferase family protein n=1 Tax=Burkholderia theae TaxID=3143496 RepID=A0ABU9WLK9_9BURK
MKTIFIGGFGAGNLGDDLILASMLDIDASATVVAYGPPLTERRIEYIAFDTFFRNAHAILGTHERVVLGGGGIFWSQEHIYELLVIALIAKGLGMRVELRRVGLHGFHYGMDASRHLLRVADVVTLREHDSLDLACRLLGCPTATFEPDYACARLSASPPPRNARPRVGVNIASTRFIDDPSFSNHLQQIYAHLAHRYHDVADFHYIPFCSHMSSHNQNDFAKADLLFAASEGRIKCRSVTTTVERLITECATMDLFLGERFHMHTIARMLGRPFIPFIHNEQTKYRALTLEYGDAPVYYELSQAMIIDQLADRLDAAISSALTSQHRAAPTITEFLQHDPPAADQYLPASH